MKKNFTLFALSSALLLVGCSNNQQGQSSVISSQTPTSSMSNTPASSAAGSGASEESSELESLTSEEKEAASSILADLLAEKAEEEIKANKISTNLKLDYSEKNETKYGLNLTNLSFASYGKTNEVTSFDLPIYDEDEDLGTVMKGYLNFISDFIGSSYAEIAFDQAMIEDDSGIVGIKKSIFDLEYEKNVVYVDMSKANALIKEFERLSSKDLTDLKQCKITLVEEGEGSEAASSSHIDIDGLDTDWGEVIDVIKDYGAEVLDALFEFTVDSGNYVASLEINRANIVSKLNNFFRAVEEEERKAIDKIKEENPESEIEFVELPSKTEISTVVMAVIKDVEISLSWAFSKEKLGALSFEFDFQTYDFSKLIPSDDESSSSTASSSLRYKDCVISVQADGSYSWLDEKTVPTIEGKENFKELDLEKIFGEEE